MPRRKSSRKNNYCRLSDKAANNLALAIHKREEAINSRNKRDTIKYINMSKRYYRRYVDLMGELDRKCFQFQR